MAKRRRKKKIRWTKKRLMITGEVLGVVLLFALALFALRSSGNLEAVLGLPEPVFTPAPELPEGQLTVHYFDVGQADCSLIRIPEEEGEFTVLVDAGDNGGETALLAELAALGVTELDAVVFTHPHSDHIGGGAEVLRTLACTEIYMPPVPEDMTPTGSTYEELLDVMTEKGLRYSEATAGMMLYENETAALQVLSPQPGDTWDDLNNWSVALKLVYGETSFLFTGDAEADCERKMLYAGWDVSCDVLKVGHHGSNTSSSSAFLSACHPQYAIISCGRDNSYGHPHSEVLNALQFLGITWLRTDEVGTIVVTSDGRTVALRAA